MTKTHHLDQVLQDRYQVATLDGNDVFEKAFEFQKILQATQKTGLYPYFQALEVNLGPEVIIRNKKAIMLGSNNYLGLTTDPRVRQAAIDAIKQYGTSMTGSRLLNGTMELHEAFEREIADFLKKESALVFTTGYQVNIGIISALCTPNTCLIMDESNHASLFDAAGLSGSKLRLFKHNNVQDLERVLAARPEGEAKMVAIDGIFSMEGDVAPLPEIVALCKKYKARLLVDDAHALGVLGPKGQGTAAHFGLSQDVDLIMATFSKSLASTGGYVAGDKAVVDYIKHHGRSMIFSASITPPNLAAARMSLKILNEEPWHVQKHRENSKKLKTGLVEMGWQVGPSETAILPIHVGNDTTTLMLWRDLLEAGVYVNPVLYPAVEKNKALLRISTMATHTDSHISQALEAFRSVGEKCGLIEKNAIPLSR